MQLAVIPVSLIRPSQAPQQAALLTAALLHLSVHFVSLPQWDPTSHSHTVGMVSLSWRDKGHSKSSSSSTCCPLSLHPQRWGQSVLRASSLGPGLWVCPVNLLPLS